MPLGSHRTERRKEKQLLKPDCRDPPCDYSGVEVAAGGMVPLCKMLPRITEQKSQVMMFITRYMSVTMKTSHTFAITGNNDLLTTNEVVTSMPCKPGRMKGSITLVLKWCQHIAILVAF